jgi:hypothetical protein
VLGDNSGEGHEAWYVTDGARVGLQGERVGYRELPHPMAIASINAPKKVKGAVSRVR